MVATRIPSSRPGNRRRGSAVLEAALVIVPMLAIIFAIVDFSLAIFVRNTLTNAVREGVRYGVTGRTLNASGHDASIKTIVRRHAMGFLDGSQHDSRIVIRYYNPQTGTFAVGPRSNRSGNVLELRVENYPWSQIGPVLRSSTAMSFTVQSSDIMEGQPSGPPNR